MICHRQKQPKHRREKRAMRFGAEKNTIDICRGSLHFCRKKKEHFAAKVLSGINTPCVLATGMLCRMRGLLFTRPHNATLVLIPCNDIHTIGMRHYLDIAFVDCCGCVIETHRHVGPLRRLRNRKASAVIERFSTCEPWFCQGDRIGIGWVGSQQKKELQYENMSRM